MEIVQKCQNPRTSAEEHGPYRSLALDSNPTPSSQPDLNASQEMQWSLAKEDCTCSDPSLNRQVRLRGASLDCKTPPLILGERPPPGQSASLSQLIHGLLCGSRQHQYRLPQKSWAR